MKLRSALDAMLNVEQPIKDKIKIEVVVKGSDVGGADDTNDVVLDQFVRDMHLAGGHLRRFTPPDRSMFLSVTDASVMNPALPAANVYFKIVTVLGRDAVADQCFSLDLEGFEPPAG